MRKVLISTGVAALLVLPQAAPAWAHTTGVNATTGEDAVSLQIGSQEQQALDGLRVVVSDDGVVASLSSQDHDDDGGLLEGILGDFNEDDSADDDGLLDIVDYYEDDDEDSEGLLGIIEYDEEEDQDSDGLLGDIL